MLISVTPPRSEDEWSLRARNLELSREPGKRVGHSLIERRVLLAEDNYLLALDLSTELESLGAEVLGPIADLDTALGLVMSERQIDAAVIDINLNGEFAYHLVDELVRRDIPVVFSTGCDRDAVPYRLRHIRFYSKPLPSVEVACGIADVIAEERARER